LKTKFSSRKEELDCTNKKLELLETQYKDSLKALEDKKDECARMREEI
jgi:hypothetical protein